MDQIQFQDDLEKKQHEEAITRLCDKYPEQCEQIHKNYLENLEPLIAGASIRTYLPIFVTRKVQALLNQH